MRLTWFLGPPVGASAPSPGLIAWATSGVEGWFATTFAPALRAFGGIVSVESTAPVAVQR